MNSGKAVRQATLISGKMGFAIARTAKVLEDLIETCSTADLVDDLLNPD